MGKKLTQYDFEDRVLKSLRKRDGVATVGDVATDTGLPLEETEQCLREMLQHYKSHLDVDDDGNLLYRFDPNLERRGEERGRQWHQLKKKAWGAFVFTFKIWIMGMLVGYTAIFILALLVFAIAGLAAATSSDSDTGGEFMLMPFYLILRILEVMFWISIFDDRRYGHGGYGRGYGRRGYGRGRRQKRKKKPDEPLYKKIFRYVFGPETEGDPLEPEKAFVRFVRAKKGRVTAAEWAEKTGLSLDDADSALTAGVMRFRGDIDVADDGTLVYRFDDLLVKAEEGDSVRGPAPIWKRPVKVAPLSGKNPKSTNRWITTLNGFNLIMGAFFLGMGGSAALMIGLGVIPLLFSSMFFAIPVARSFGRRRRVKQARKINERRSLVEAIYLSTESGQARRVHKDVFDTSKAGEELVRDFEAAIEVDENGEVFYTFPRVSEGLRAAERAREATAELVFGKTIFSSDEETMSLEDVEMAEFDRRLARELGGNVDLDFEMEWNQVEETVDMGR